MFTGLIETMGSVVRNEQQGDAYRLVIEAPYDELTLGESIAIQGVCLTLVAQEHRYLSFDVSPETVRLTSLGQLSCGNRVNIERAMRANARLGGHYVSGHVDTTARLKSIVSLGDYLELGVGDFVMPANLYAWPKGSICIDGVSLTINALVDADIQLMLVPHTLKVTTFGHYVEGQLLNIEFDYLSRIVAHQLQELRLKNDVSFC
jgi:riboflavin synthase